MRYNKRRWRATIFASVAAGTVLVAAGASLAASPTGTRHGLHGFALRQQALNAYARAHSSGIASPLRTADDGDLADQFAQYNYERTAPAQTVSGQALVSAQRQAADLPTAGGSWQEFTTQPYNAQPSNYTDPFWGNQGAGFSLVGGRTTALAAAPDGTWFAGTADGGVWTSSDQGGTWTPRFDAMASLSIGALAVSPADGSVWVGTGEANQSADSYAGTGVYSTTNDGASWQPVGLDSSGVSPLAGHTIFKIVFDPNGVAYAATDNGLFRYSAGTWTEVLGGNASPPYDWQVTTVAVVPGTNGKDVIAAIGWHGPGNTENNGFYSSTDGGNTFTQVTPTGDINAGDIGRTTFAYSADGSKLYAIVQSLNALATGQESALQGVFVASGSPASVAGPWTKVGDEASLAASGSALAVGSGYGVGVQAWYNQVITVDPTNASHVYIGLEEVFESSDAGAHWDTASPYWNYPFACDANNTCPNTTHPDQHAAMIVAGKIVIGNDGGVYSRPLSDTGTGDWTDLNATLRSWQYYDARAGLLPDGATQVVGGLQDNGTSVVSTESTQMAEPAGGDGFDVIVNPGNANNWVGEYTDGAMYSTTDGGHSFADPVSPTCYAESLTNNIRPDCDPSARFVTPLIQDHQNSNVWVIGGRYVWISHDGWRTSCTLTACSWTQAYDTGAGHAVTALASVRSGKVVYAAWVRGGNPGPSFASGIATNYGGSWHQVNTAGLPNRFIAGVTVDPSDPAHVYAVFNGYSRRWVPGGGVGHVFESFDGGQSWTDISGNLPDIPGDALVLLNHKLALATDQGVFTAAEGQGSSTSWSVLGTGLPNASVNDLTIGPDGTIYAATHGRGVWRIKL